MAFRQAGEADSYLLTAGQAGGVSYCQIDHAEVACVEVLTNAAGLIEWIADKNTRQITVTRDGCFNRPPAFSAFAVGVPVAPSANVPYFTVRDPNTTDDSIQVGSLDLDLTDPLGVTVSAVVNGVWQAGFNGTIAASGNGWRVTVEAHDPYMVGTWTATARASDAPGETTERSWTFDVEWAAPTLSHTEPLGAVDEMARIYCRATSTTFGFDMTTISMTLKDSITKDGDEYLIIDAGVFQPGFNGAIIDDGSANPLTFDIMVRSWPEEIEGRRPPRLWTFEVTATTIIGTVL
jgi:hypothetical protein